MRKALILLAPISLFVLAACSSEADHENVAPFDSALSDRYLVYALSTITARSLPDLRDGMKPVHRRLLWAMRALRMEPNDVNALAGQGEAYVQRGAVERARRNLERVQTLCRAPCPQAQQLAAVIQRGPPAEVLAAQQPEQGAPPATPRAPRPN